MMHDFPPHITANQTASKQKFAAVMMSKTTVDGL